MFATFLVAAAVASSVFNFVQAGPCTRTYTIQDGDICDSISAQHNVSTYQLAVINAGYIDSICSNLKPGATICLGYEGEDCLNTYVVHKDDTCSQISEAYGIDLNILYENNAQINSDCNNMYIGEVLCVANSVIVPPPPSDYSVPTSIPTTATPATPDPTYPAYDDTSDEDLPFCDEL